MKSDNGFVHEKLHYFKWVQSHFLFSFLGLLTIFIFFILYPINPNHHVLDGNLKNPQKDNMSCDIFDGKWVPDLRESQYTNSSCTTIPETKNCFKNGRKDREFLKWKWKPNGCEIPRFNPKKFLGIVRGKKLAFIGDSVARNQMESLLCLLSQEEIPKDMYKDSEDRFRIWYFYSYDFTLSMLWSKFLVTGKERFINGSSSTIFDLYLNKIDNEWARHLPTINYAIISDAHWFFRQLYLHEGDKVVGCVYCNDPNVTNLSPSIALKMVLRAAFSYINKCKNCNETMTLLRTFSPAHFANGTWNTGGSCVKTNPKKEIDLNGFEWEFRRFQMEEIERAKKEGEKKGKKFGILDVTKAMLMRVDGHPGAYWGNKWMKGYSDCVHWCLPGPIDVWNDFLMVILGKETQVL